MCVLTHGYIYSTSVISLCALETVFWEKLAREMFGKHGKAWKSMVREIAPKLYILSVLTKMLFCFYCHISVM